MTDPIQQLSNKMDSKFDQLTESISQLAQAIARREERDHHIDEKLSEQKRTVDTHGQRIDALEKVQAGDSARKELINWIVKPMLGLVGAAIFAAIVWGASNGVGKP